MRRRASILIAVLVLALALPAMAELQNVTVGGTVRVKGNYISNVFTNGAAPGQVTPEVRWPGGILGGRVIGNVFVPPFAPNDVVSIFDWSSRGSDLKFVEHRTRLNAKADFTDEVSAFIELDSYDWWGEDFRSNYITGADARAATGDDVEIFQAYIEANNMFDYPVRLRIGRQEMAFGSQFLVGTNDFAFFFTGLSFDAVRLTYTHDVFTLDAWWSKINEASPIEEDGDTDFYGLYASYNGIENLTLDAYWMMLRDATSVTDTPGSLFQNWWEHLWGVDDYDPTCLHTIGIRAAGKYGPVDFEGELAYQFGDADRIGSLFKLGAYGDDDADFDNLGGHLNIGYAPDLKYHPRFFVDFLYFGGEDNRDVTFWELLNPFRRAESSISFNRLFSNQICSGFCDLNNDLSNAWVLCVGVMAAPTEKLRAAFMVTRFDTLEEFDAPRHFKLGRIRVPIAPALSWWDQENDDLLGYETHLTFAYNYSEDLVFEIGWAHFFLGEGSEDGQFSRWNGLLYTGGTDDDDADYVYVGSTLKF